jgi:hypothetical protein
MLGAWVGLIGDGEVGDRLLVWHTVKRLARKPLKQLRCEKPQYHSRGSTITSIAAVSIGATHLFQSVPSTD